MTPMNLTVRAHHDDDGSLWADVAELPGCFASGQTPAELIEAVQEAIGLYLDPSGPRDVTVTVTGLPLAAPLPA